MPASGVRRWVGFVAAVLAAGVAGLVPPVLFSPPPQTSPTVALTTIPAPMWRQIDRAGPALSAYLQSGDCTEVDRLYPQLKAELDATEYGNDTTAEHLLTVVYATYTVSHRCEQGQDATEAANMGLNSYIKLEISQPF